MQNNNGAAWLPEAGPSTGFGGGGRFDLVGALGLSVGLLCFLLAVSKGSDWGWGSAQTILVLPPFLFTKVRVLARGPWTITVTPQ